MRRVTALCFIVIILLGIVYSGCTRKQLEKEITIASVKSVKFEEYVGKELTLKGYFVDRPVPMLLSSMHWLNINMPIPESEYIRLSGKGIEEILPEKLYGSYVMIEGKIILTDSKEIDIMRKKIGDIYAVEFICTTSPIILEKSESILIPKIYNLCEINPSLCAIPPFFTRTKYALLLSGGANAVNAHSRYWNDLKFMYNTLRSQYNFSDENIVVVYKDGTAEDNDMVVDYTADSAGVRDAIKYLQNKMKSTDLLVLFITNHGGGFMMEEVNGRNVGGRVDDSGDETDEAVFEEHLNTDLNADGDRVDQVSFDERIYLYNDTQDLWDDQLAHYLNLLKYNKMLIVLEQCFSGGFLADLRGTKRVIVSASSEYEFSWGGGPGNHDIFSYHFTSALAGQTHDGTAVNADTDNNGKVSVLEAFNYAVQNDTAAENPFYEDSNDGRGHHGAFPKDGDGNFGSSFYLD